MTPEKINETYNAVIAYIRIKHTAEIDEAYDFFWEEEDPEEFLQGNAMTLGFLNFEDWMVCDYKPKDKPCFIDRYIEENSPSEEQLKTLEALKSSFISIFEVKGPDGDGFLLHDLASKKDVIVSDPRFGELPTGYLLGARIIETPKEFLIGRCIYPFGTELRQDIIDSIEHQCARFRRHIDENATHADYLRSETYACNMLWTSHLFRTQ